MQAALSVGLVACGQASGVGTDSGTPVDSGPITLTSLTDVCDGVSTLTGANVLSITQPYYQATFTPITGAPTALELFVSTTNTPTIVCHPHQTSTEGPPDVAASISVTVQAQFATADKTFGESFAATITLSAAEVDQSLAFLGTEPVASIQGTFQPVIAGTWTTHDLSFGGTLLSSAVSDGSPGSTTGTITEQASSGNMGKVQGAGSWK